VFATIDRLRAAEASRAGGPGGSTIAGHVHHLTASVALSTSGLRGESTSRDRSRSWTVSVVDDAAWAALRARLRDEYERLLVAVETHARWDEDALGVAIGALAHTAYHLGAMRQRVAPASARSASRSDGREPGESTVQSITPGGGALRTHGRRSPRKEQRSDRAAGRG